MGEIQLQIHSNAESLPPCHRRRRRRRRRRRYCTAFVICPSLVNLSTDKKGWAHASFLAATSANSVIGHPLSDEGTRQETGEITRVTVAHSADAKCAHGGMRIYPFGIVFRSISDSNLLPCASQEIIPKINVLVP